MNTRNYKFYFDKNGYIVACGAVEDNDFDFTGQMSQYRAVLDSFDYGGYYKFENGKFILDEERKALKLKEYEERNK